MEDLSANAADNKEECSPKQEELPPKDIAKEIAAKEELPKDSRRKDEGQKQNKKSTKKVKAKEKPTVAPKPLGDADMPWAMLENPSTAI